MSANVYCGNGPYVDTFVELCPAAQFRIIIQLLYVPVIVVGSILIMATIYLLKKLHTPHDFVLFAIAVVDLIIGVVGCPLYLLKVFPETGLKVAAHGWFSLIFGIRFQDKVSFDLLTLMCIDRFIMIWKPIWYKNHVTKRAIIISMSGVFVVSAIENIVVVVLNFTASSETLWYFAILLCLLFCLEIVISCGLCIKAVIVALSRHSKRKMSALPYGEYARVKFNVIIMSSLVFLFLVLWLPTLISVVAWLIDSSFMDIHPIFPDLAFTIRFINSGLNAFVYAATRPIYRTSFKFLLTTPPWKWRELPRMQLRQEIVGEILITPMSRRPERESGNKSKGSSGTSEKQETNFCELNYSRTNEKQETNFCELNSTGTNEKQETSSCELNSTGTSITQSIEHFIHSMYN